MSEFKYEGELILGKTPSKPLTEVEYILEECCNRGCPELYQTPIYDCDPPEEMLIKKGKAWAENPDLARRWWATYNGSTPTYYHEARDVYVYERNHNFALVLIVVFGVWLIGTAVIEMIDEDRPALSSEKPSKFTE